MNIYLKLILFVNCKIALGALENLKLEFEAKKMQFKYLNAIEKERDIENGFLNESVPTPLDVDVDYTGDERRIFVTLPRFKKGIPITLGTIDPTNKSILIPYPNWQWHRDPTSCKSERLISVFRIKIDKCGRLWVLDTGKYGSSQTCPPQILAIDLKTDKVIFKKNIPKNMVFDVSDFVTVAVDVLDSCNETFAYFADNRAFNIIVYDVQKDQFWKINHRSFYPDPAWGDFDIQGSTMRLMDGVMGIDLTTHIKNNKDKLFYSALSSNVESWVYSKHLRNMSNFENGLNMIPNEFHTLKTTRASQSAGMAIDKNGVMFFGLMTECSINCWHTGNSEYGKYIATLAQDNEQLQFPSGVKVATNKEDQEELWFLTSKFQKAFTSTMNINETNFRIFSGDIRKLIKGKRCRSTELPIEYEY